FTEYNPLTAHNSYVLVLAELGVVGYVLWFSFLLSCVSMMLYLRSPPPRREEDWEWLVEQYSGSSDDGADGSENGYNPDLNGSTKPTWEISPEDATIANVIFFSFTGYATAAFFLSRSYEVVLFVLCAMAAGHYLGARQHTDGLPAYGFFSRLGWWITLSMISIVALYLITKILLLLS
ncbi:MAG TPA: hypothetical protein ENJ43_05095, partial [Gammaproteobacteria bacterium]|nr:hypothetical protein [Gammaproteobacteria bacterium]